MAQQCVALSPSVCTWMTTEVATSFTHSRKAMSKSWDNCRDIIHFLTWIFLSKLAVALALCCEIGTYQETNLCIYHWSGEPQPFCLECSLVNTRTSTNKNLPLLKMANLEQEKKGRDAASNVCWHLRKKKSLSWNLADYQNFLAWPVKQTLFP